MDKNLKFLERNDIEFFTDIKQKLNNIKDLSELVIITGN